jgi:hypothetical protein
MAAPIVHPTPEGCNNLNINDLILHPVARSTLLNGLNEELNPMVIIDKIPSGFPCDK